jgi:hypothetical protein
MKKYKERIIQSEEIEKEIQRRKEAYFQNCKQAGFPEEEIERLKFKERFKLNYPSNPFNFVYVKSLSLIFDKSDMINIDILSEVIRGVTEISIEEFVNENLGEEEGVRLYAEKIVDVFIEKMELLYYFMEDDVFAELVFSLCNLHCLDVVQYGFIENSKTN